jgi:purine-binding chemotaxis protein CheW
MTPAQSTVRPAEPAQYLTFMLAQEQFAIGILGIKEIIEYHGVTEVPMMPASVRGVINLRGAVLPIVDLAARLGFETGEASDRNVIIVAQIGEQVVGLLVDAVSDILTVTDDVIQPTPDVASDTAKTFVRGLLAIDGRMISLIGLERVLPDFELEAA